jgi:hypothetical protein
MQKIAASWLLILHVDAATAQRLIEVHLRDIATHEVGNRPGRVEPRAVKRRPKPHRLLTTPRREAKAKLMASPE